MNGSAPALRLPPRSIARGADHVVGRSRNGRVIRVDHYGDDPSLPANRHRLDNDIPTAPVEQPKHFDRSGLRFGRHNPRAQPPERGDTITDMRTDVEYEIAGSYETAVESIHGGGTRTIAIIDVKRSCDAARGPYCLEHRLNPNLAVAPVPQSSTRAEPGHPGRSGRSSPRAAGQSRPGRTACQAKATR